jgi:tagaturonate reductase
MQLQKKILSRLQNKAIVLPDETVFKMPEKIIQFGTGVLLRGLPDYFIDKANRNGIFNGRIVIVKSTTHGDTGDFKKQDYLYTTAIRGFKNGLPVSENIINASVSRVLIANTEWDQILTCAENPEMKIVFSNTTESGIVLVEESVFKNPPSSFPAKLLSFLYKRYTFFKGADTAGMVIVPAELIPENGKQLQSIILALAAFNKLEEAFINWLQNKNYFCNSLVDRIVPGHPDVQQLQSLQQEIGYEDSLLIIAEPYCLWAIEAPVEIKKILSFSEADENIIIQEDINEYRELKLRLLNATHTFCSGPAVLAGFATVAEAMADEKFAAFATALMQNEIAPAIPLQINEKKKIDFSNEVLNRFRNPVIEHQWLSITSNYTGKIKLRTIPLLTTYFKQGKNIPPLITTCFAAYIKFMKVFKIDNEKYYGKACGREYVINDVQAAYFYKAWQQKDIQALVTAVLQNQFLWDTDLSVIPGFANAVAEKLLNENEYIGQS